MFDAAAVKKRKTIWAADILGARINVTNQEKSMETLAFDAAKLIEICRNNDVAMIGVFGSMARGEANDQSDIDLLVRFSNRKSLLALVKLERELSAVLGRGVEVLTEPSISPYLREIIQQELKVLYEA